ncbi:peptide ABC transporter permease [Clostridia bacterium]|nr:peptide ABC transporter permease [Clostridia bacterium]
MAKYIGVRLLLMLLLLLGMTFIVFGSLYIAPGDPAMMVAGPSASPEDIDRVRTVLGLDRPFLVQYGLYLKNVITLNLGVSFTTRQPILTEIAIRLPNTLNLACASILLSILVGIPTGIITALNKDRLVDSALTTTALMGISLPNFWLGTMLIYLFSVKFRLFPSGGMTEPFWTPLGFRQVILPAIALSTGTIAGFTRIGRSAMLDVLQSDYIRTAKSKGLSGKVVVCVHALRNVLIPLITQFGTSFGGLLGGAVITEQVFVVNGIGSYLINAINTRNYPVVQSSVLIIATLFITVNLIVDILYSFIDPRIKYQ